jgi:hypothetical protein
MEKRAQFFIIASLIVSSLILGTSAIRNQAREEVVETATVDLSQELSYEAHRVLDNGVFTAKSQADIQTQMKELVAAYGASNPDSDIEILFGDPTTGLQQVEYDTSTGSQVKEVDEANIVVDKPTDEPSTPTELREARKIKVKIKVPKEKESDEEKTIERELALYEGQNVYVIIKKKIRNDQTVIIQP